MERNEVCFPSETHRFWKQTYSNRKGKVEARDALEDGTETYTRTEMEQIIDKDLLYSLGT